MKEIQYKDIPEDVWFWVPEENRGQDKETAYGDRGFGHHDKNAPYRRILDHTLHFTHPGRVTYYKTDGKP